MDGKITVCGCRSCKSPVELEYQGKTLYFCVEKCKIEFLAAENKEEWLRNHQ